MSARDIKRSPAVYADMFGATTVDRVRLACFQQIRALQIIQV